MQGFSIDCQGYYCKENQAFHQLLHGRIQADHHQTVIKNQRDEGTNWHGEKSRLCTARNGHASQHQRNQNLGFKLIAGSSGDGTHLNYVDECCNACNGACRRKNKDFDPVGAYTRKASCSFSGPKDLRNTTFW